MGFRLSLTLPQKEDEGPIVTHDGHSAYIEYESVPCEETGVSNSVYIYIYISISNLNKSILVSFYILQETDRSKVCMVEMIRPISDTPVC